MREKARTQNEEIQEQINGILLPHQQERFAQIRIQMRMQGGTRGLASEELRDALGLTDEQIQKLREVSEERNRKLAEEMRQLREQARKEVLEQVLSAAQLQKLETMIGEPFAFPNEGRERFNRFGGGPPNGGGFGRGRDRGGDNNRPRRPQRPDTQ